MSRVAEAIVEAGVALGIVYFFTNIFTSPSENSGIGRKIGRAIYQQK